MTRTEDTLAAVESLLDDQRAALLAGDLASLSLMPDRLERALQRLAGHRPPPAATARLAQVAQRNAALLQAASRGVAQTSARLTATRAGSLTTYDATGRRAAAPNAGRVLSRR